MPDNGAGVQIAYGSGDVCGSCSPTGPRKSIITLSCDPSGMYNHLDMELSLTFLKQKCQIPIRLTGKMFKEHSLVNPQLFILMAQSTVSQHHQGLAIK